MSVLNIADKTKNAVLYKIVAPRTKRHRKDRETQRNANKKTRNLPPWREKEDSAVRLFTPSPRFIPASLIYRKRLQPNKIFILLQSSRGFISWVTIPNLGSCLSCSATQVTYNNNKNKWKLFFK